MRIVLISPPAPRFVLPAAPLGLSRLAGWLGEVMSDIQVEGWDLEAWRWRGAGMTTLQSLQRALDMLQKTPPDCVGISLLQDTQATAELLATAAQALGSVTVAGGIQPTLLPHRELQGFDYYVRGEGELPLAGLLTALQTGKDPHEANIMGLGWGRHEPEIACPPPQTVVDRSVFDMANAPFHYYEARVVSSSGCPQSCTFCANALFGNRWQPRAVEDVMHEISGLLRDKHITQIAFSDDQFLGFSPSDTQRAYGILAQCDQLSRCVRWVLQVRTDRWLQALQECPPLGPLLSRMSARFVGAAPEGSSDRPVRGVCLDMGVESLVDQRLRNFRKGTTADMNIQAVRAAQALDLDVGVYMLTFTPDLTMSDLELEWQRYSELVLDQNTTHAAFYQFFTELVPYEATPVFEFLHKKDLLRGDNNQFAFCDADAALCYVLVMAEIQAGVYTHLSLADACARVQAMMTLAPILAATQEGQRIAADVCCPAEDMQAAYSELISLLPSLDIGG